MNYVPFRKRSHGPWLTCLLFRKKCFRAKTCLGDGTMLLGNRNRHNCTSFGSSFASHNLKKKKVKRATGPATVCLAASKFQAIELRVGFYRWKALCHFLFLFLSLAPRHSWTHLRASTAVELKI